MTLAQRVDSFYRRLDQMLTRQVGYSWAMGELVDHVCDHETMRKPVAAPGSILPHSMFFARLAADEANLPPALLQIAEREFECSCQILHGYDKYLSAAVADLMLKGELQSAENLSDWRCGFWNAELLEAVEQACGDDAEALEVLRKRFAKWQQTGERKSAQYFDDFLNGVSDRLLVGVAREHLRQKHGPDFPGF
jgi:hypothetical protein